MAKRERLATVLKAAGLALFCAAFGLAGAVGGIWLMADELKGDEGPTGPPGMIGPAGEAGLEGPPGPAGDVSQVEAEMATLRMSVKKLTPRVDSLEDDVAAIPTTAPTPTGCTPGTPTEVVTSAQLTKSGDNTSLSTTKATITPCQ